MKKIYLIMFVLFSLTGSAFAAGDLEVSGNATVTGDLSVGTSTQKSNIIINGVTFSNYRIANLGEDVYGSWVKASNNDTCHLNNNAQYECSPTKEGPCIDVYFNLQFPAACCGVTLCAKLGA